MSQGPTSGLAAGNGVIDLDEAFSRLSALPHKSVVCPLRCRCFITTGGPIRRGTICLFTSVYDDT